MVMQAPQPVGLSLWSTAQPWWEFGLRALLVYGFLFLPMAAALGSSAKRAGSNV